MVSRLVDWKGHEYRRDLEWLGFELQGERMKVRGENESKICFTKNLKKNGKKSQICENLNFGRFFFFCVYLVGTF